MNLCNDVWLLIVSHLAPANIKQLKRVAHRFYTLVCQSCRRLYILPMCPYSALDDIIIRRPRLHTLYIHSIASHTIGGLVVERQWRKVIFWSKAKPQLYSFTGTWTHINTDHVCVPYLSELRVNDRVIDMRLPFKTPFFQDVSKWHVWQNVTSPLPDWLFNDQHLIVCKCNTRSALQALEHYKVTSAPKVLLKIGIYILHKTTDFLDDKFLKTVLSPYSAHCAIKVKLRLKDVTEVWTNRNYRNLIVKNRA